MKNIWIGIKAICIVILGASIFAIMAATTLVYTIVSSLKQIRFKKTDEPQSTTDTL